MTNSKIWVFALYLQSLSREESLCHIGDMFYNFLCILIKRMPHLVAMYQRQGMLKTYMFLNLGPHRTKIIPWFVFKYIHKHKCHQYYIHCMMFSQEIHISIGQWPREIWFSVCECVNVSFYSLVSDWLRPCVIQHIIIYVQHWCVTPYINNDDS